MALFRVLNATSLKNSIQVRLCCSTSTTKKGLILGAYTKENGQFTLTSKAECFDKKNSGILLDNLRVSGIKKGASRIFYRPSPGYDIVAVVGLGPENAGYNESEDIDERRENVRAASGAGVKSLQSLEVTHIDVEDLGDAQASAEGATLGAFGYQAFKNEKKKKKRAVLSAYDLEDKSQWDQGVVQGEAQNWARELMDTPANHLTPEIFAQEVQEELSKLNVQVTVHDGAWAKNKGMGAFLSVAQGSDQPPKFLEMSFKNGPKDAQPIVLVGKGVTFDSGGISIKPSAKMDEMRGDMGGAACVVSTLKAVAKLKLPVNVIGLTPLTENLINGRATKPGDIVTAMNGKTIQVDNTDAEGRLILADALCYAAEFSPKVTLDIATLTGAMRVALGGALTGVFSNSTPMFEALRKAGVVSGDRVWRFPLVNHYTMRVTEFPNVDVNNVGKGVGGGACTAAAFLKEFAPKGDWMHLDVAGVMGPESFPDTPYLDARMSGRPTRTVIQFVRQLSESC